MIHPSRPEPGIALVELDTAPANIPAMAERARLLEAFAQIEADKAMRAAFIAKQLAVFEGR